MRKLTDKLKYDLLEDTAVIYGKKQGSDKWEPAFTCHIRTIAYIKERGFKQSLHLLRVYK